MRGYGGLRKGRYHLVLSVEVWETLVAEARRRRIRVSHVAQERLAASLGITEGGGVRPETPADHPVENGRRHHCRLSMDSVIWGRLAREAAKRGVSVTEMVRQRLREAVLGKVPERRWEGPSEPADGRPGQDVRDDGRVRPKSITVYEL